MEENDANESPIVRAVHDICARSTTYERREECFAFLHTVLDDKNIIKYLHEVVANEEEDMFTRKFASNFLIRCLERVNPLVSPINAIFTKGMKEEKKQASMQKGFLQFIEIVTENMHQENLDANKFIVTVISKYMRAEDDLHLNEVGVLLLHGFLQNIDDKILPFIKEISQSYNIVLGKAKDALQKDPENWIAFFYHTLMCAKNLSKVTLILEPFRRSLRIVLVLLKHSAANGDECHFIEASDLLLDLMEYKHFKKAHWMLPFGICECICSSKKYYITSRIRTFEILGNAVHQRISHIEKDDVFERLFRVAVNTLSQREDYSDYAKTSEKTLPTPMSAAADLLEYIAQTYPASKTCQAFVNVLNVDLKASSIDQWKFRGLFITLGRIIRSCGHYMNEHHTKELAIMFRGAFTDACVLVRQSALYALEKALTHLYHQCGPWAKDIFPTVFSSLTFLIPEFGIGLPQHPLHVERLFSTLKVYLEILENDLATFLPMMMDVIQDVIDNVETNRIKICVVELLQKIALHTGTAILPHMNTIMGNLNPYLVDWDIEENIELLPFIVDLLAVIMEKTLPEIMNCGGDKIIDLILNLLKMQHAQTQLKGAGIVYLLKYSPMRCSIFRFFEKISIHGTAVPAASTLKLLGTLVCTATTIKSICPEILEYEGNNNQHFAFIENTIRPPLLGQLKTGPSLPPFEISENNDVETAKYDVVNDSFRITDEVHQALATMQSLQENCPSILQPYAVEIFLKLSRTLRSSCSRIRKQLLLTLNAMLATYLNDFQFEDSNFMDIFALEVLELIDEERSDIMIVGESARGFLYYACIVEKYLQSDMETHLYLWKAMLGIFLRVSQLPHSNAPCHRAKETVLCQIISFLLTLSKLCSKTRFNNYFGVGLYIFDAKINMPMFRAPSSDERRCWSYAKLTEGFHLIDLEDELTFKRITKMLLKGLDDPVIDAREKAATGLGMLVDHYALQRVAVYKSIFHDLWKHTKREKSSIVLDSICFAMVQTVNKNIWQQPLKKLTPKIVSLLPIRHKVNYNFIMIEFFERLCTERPTEIAKVVKDLYKHVVEILNSDRQTDIDPLYRRALKLASTLYSMHLDELRQLPINPVVMQAILSSLKNRACLKALLR